MCVSVGTCETSYTFVEIVKGFEVGYYYEKFFLELRI